MRNSHFSVSTVAESFMVLEDAQCVSNNRSMQLVEKLNGEGGYVLMNPESLLVADVGNVSGRRFVPIAPLRWR